MFRYRVYDKDEERFRNVVFKDRVENLTEVKKREFKALFAGDPEYSHTLRIISGPMEVDG